MYIRPITQCFIQSTLALISLAYILFSRQNCMQMRFIFTAFIKRYFVKLFQQFVLFEAFPSIQCFWGLSLRVVALSVTIIEQESTLCSLALFVAFDTKITTPFFGQIQCCHCVFLYVFFVLFVEDRS